MEQTVFSVKIKGVQFYSEHAKELLYSQRNKILRFLECRCLEYDGDGVFLCLPIPGYNKTTYSMKKNVVGDWECSCQFYQKYKKLGEVRFCSHLGALFEFFKRGRKYE